jgi:hypothetical protein
MLALRGRLNAKHKISPALAIAPAAAARLFFILLFGVMMLLSFPAIREQSNVGFGVTTTAWSTATSISTRWSPPC